MAFNTVGGPAMTFIGWGIRQLKDESANAPKSIQTKMIRHMTTADSLAPVASYATSKSVSRTLRPRRFTAAIFECRSVGVIVMQGR